MTDYGKLISAMINGLVDDLSKIPGVTVKVEISSIIVTVEGETEDTGDSEDGARKGRLSDEPPF